MHKNYQLFIVLFSFLIFHSTSYSLNGNWSLNEITDRPLSENASILMEVSDFIFQGKELMKKIYFSSSCQNYKYLADISENNFFFNYESYFV
jgi:hypothetical protein